MNPTTRTYQRRVAAIRRSTATAAVALWDGLPTYDRASIDQFVPQALRVVTAGQLLAGRTTAAYVSRLTGTRLVPITSKAVTGRAARPTNPADVYERPFHSVWAGLADGSSLEVAVGRGRAQLAMLAATDVWLATRAAAVVVDKATPTVTRWVRVADGGACDLCSAADGMETTSAGDFAGHPGCGCTAEPQTTGDPSSEASAPDQFDTTDDDELGPLLVAA